MGKTCGQTLLWTCYEKLNAFVSTVGNSPKKKNAAVPLICLIFAEKGT